MLGCGVTMLASCSSIPPGNRSERIQARQGSKAVCRHPLVSAFPGVASQRGQVLFRWPNVAKLTRAAGRLARASSHGTAKAAASIRPASLPSSGFQQLPVVCNQRPIPCLVPSPSSSSVRPSFLAAAAVTTTSEERLEVSTRSLALLSICGDHLLRSLDCYASSEGSTRSFESKRGKQISRKTIYRIGIEKHYMIEDGTVAKQSFHRINGIRLYECVARFYCNL